MMDRTAQDRSKTMNARKHSPQIGMSGFPMQAWAGAMELAEAANAALAALTASPAVRPAPPALTGPVAGLPGPPVSPRPASAVGGGSNLGLAWLGLPTEVSA